MKNERRWVRGRRAAGFLARRDRFVDVERLGFVLERPVLSEEPTFGHRAAVTLCGFPWGSPVRITTSRPRGSASSSTPRFTVVWRSSISSETWTSLHWPRHESDFYSCWGLWLEMKGFLLRSGDPFSVERFSVQCVCSTQQIMRLWVSDTWSVKRNLLTCNMWRNLQPLR